METKKNFYPAFKSLLVAFSAVGAMAMQDASAATYNFMKITNNGPDNLASQLTMEVLDVGTGASFTFYNNVGIASSITDIYFDAVSTTTPFSSYGAWTGSAGVSFSAYANPADLPSGNTIGFTATYSGDSNTPNPVSNGVNASGEWVSVTGTFDGTENFANLIAALADGTFRVGLHVQSIGTTSNSDGYVNNVAPVPLPAAAWLFGPALVGLVTLSRRKKI